MTDIRPHPLTSSVYINSSPGFIKPTEPAFNDGADRIRKPGAFPLGNLFFLITSTITFASSVSSCLSVSVLSDGFSSNDTDNGVSFGITTIVSPSPTTQT